MNKLKLIKTLFKEFKNEDYLTRIYLISDYLTNMRDIRKRYRLGVFRRLFFYKLPKPVNNSNTNKAKHDNPDLPNLQQELDEIKTKILHNRIDKVINYMRRIQNYLDIRHLFDLKNSQDNIQKFFAFLSEFIGIYKRSLQELVEGQREVTQNKHFRFEDGKTVQEKLDKFEAKIKEHMNIKNTINKFQNRE